MALVFGLAYIFPMIFFLSYNTIIGTHYIQEGNFIKSNLITISRGRRRRRRRRNSNENKPYNLYILTNNIFL